MSEILDKEFEKLIDNLDIEYFSDKEILITGATGNIMSYWIHFLYYCQKKGIYLKKVHAVTLSGNFPRTMRAPSNFTVHKGDLTEPRFIESLPFVDVVIHAGGYAQPGKFLSDPIKTMFINTSSTYYLSQKVRDGGVFLFLSSSEVYSGLDEKNYREDRIGTTTPSHPRAPYIEGKRGGETISQILFREKRIKSISARVSLAYGPGFRSGDSRVLNSFIENAVLRKEISMIDGGEAIRTYCYIPDAIFQLWKIITSGTKPTFNVGGTSRTSIRNLAEIIADQTGSLLLIPEISSPILGAPTDVSVDLSEILQLCGDLELTSLEDGIRQTIYWYNNEIS
jgi:UDP-glucuronate decarboxylase